MQKSDYVTILIGSLEKKIVLLDRIIAKNKAQKAILSQKEVSPDDFENNFNEKAKLIDDLAQLDNGFEEVYNRIKGELIDNKSFYMDEIKKLQELITYITEKSNTIQVQEKRNRDLAEKQFAFVKERTRKIQTGTKVANQYYRNMARLNYIDPQFMDKKK